MAVAQGLLMLQGAFGLTGTVGMVALMGFDPVYAIAPLTHAVLLMVLGAFVARSRRWALVAVMVLEVLAVGAWQLQLLAGLAPQLDFTVNLTGVVTALLLPLTVLVLCAHRLATRA